MCSKELIKEKRKWYSRRRIKDHYRRTDREIVIWERRGEKETRERRRSERIGLGNLKNSIRRVRYRETKITSKLGELRRASTVI